MRLTACLLTAAALLAKAQAPPAPRLPPAPPRLVSRLAPEYSEEARAAGLEGTVTLYAEVDEHGNPVRVHVLAPLGMGLDEKAVEAVSKWHYQPGTIDGRPARFGMELEVPFQLPAPGAWHLSRTRYIFGNSDRKTPMGGDTPVLTRPVLAKYAAPDPAACQYDSGALTFSTGVMKDGTPKQPHLTRGAEGPAATAALHAIESWRFVPGRRNGKATATTAEFELSCAAGAVPEETSATRIGNGVTPPQLRNKVEPEYSEEARRAKYQGNILLSLDVGPDGYAHHIYTLRMLGLGLDEKAIEAVRQWRFAPGMKDGKPVRVQATIEVNFRLL